MMTLNLTGFAICYSFWIVLMTGRCADRAGPSVPTTASSRP